MKWKRENGIKEYNFYSSDLDYEILRKIFIEGLKTMTYPRHYGNEDLNMYYSMQLTTKQIECFLGSFYVEPGNSSGNIWKKWL